MKTSIDESKIKERKNIKINFKMPIKKVALKQPEEKVIVEVESK